MPSRSIASLSLGFGFGLGFGLALGLAFGLGLASPPAFPSGGGAELQQGAGPRRAVSDGGRVQRRRAL